MKFFLLKRKSLVALGCLLAACAMFCAVNAPAIVAASATTRQLPIYCVRRDQKMLSVSFDAAWGDGRLRQPMRCGRSCFAPSWGGQPLPAVK